MYIEINTSDRRRNIDQQYVISEIREDVCLALPFHHLFTRNDNTSVFYGIGKVKALKIIIQSEHHIKTFNAVGDYFTLNTEVFTLFKQFVCELYELSQSSRTTKARYKKFCSKKEIISGVRCLGHIKRENYVTATAQKSLIPCSAIPSPCENYGWRIKDGLFQIQWMLWKPVPNELFESISCSGRKSKCWGNQCVCRSHKLHVRTSATVIPVKIKVKTLVLIYLTKMKMKLK